MSASAYLKIMFQSYKEIKKISFLYKDKRARPKNVEADDCLFETRNYLVFAHCRHLILKLVVQVFFFGVGGVASTLRVGFALKLHPHN